MLHLSFDTSNDYRALHSHGNQSVWMWMCVCGRLCGGSGGVLAYTGLSFVYGMKLYGEQHPLYIVIVWKICLFHVFVTGVLGGGGGIYVDEIVHHGAGLHSTSNITAF